MTFEDRFQLKVPLGETTHGTVWSAEDQKLKRKAVVSLLDEDAADAVRQRFEALIDGGVASLRGTVVISRVIDAGRNAEGMPYIVTELQADAPSLADRFVDGAAVKVDAATRVVVDLLGAITTMGTRGLAHGDIEPGNVLLVERSGRFSPRLIGFGLNRASVREGAVPLESPDHLSTLSYMAPEQADGSATDGASADLFSTMAILYSWITGRLPFRGADVASLRAAAGSLHVPRVGKVRPELADTALAAVIDKALSRDPADRFESASALTSKLRSSLLHTRAARDLDVVVGERSAMPDDSDAELSEERASGPTPMPGPKLSLRKPSDLPPRPSTPKTAPAKEDAKPAAETEGAEKTADAPATGDEEPEFENISGLLMIPEAGPPERVKPRKLPPPAGKAAAQEPAGGAEAKEAGDVEAKQAGNAEAPEEAAEEEDTRVEDLDAVIAALERPPNEEPTAEEAPAAAVVAPAAPEPAAPAAPDEADAEAPAAPGVEAAAGEAAAVAPGVEAAAVAPNPDGSDVPPSADVMPAADLDARHSAAYDDPVEDYVLPSSRPSRPMIGAGIAALVLVLVGGAWLGLGGDDGESSAAVEPTTEAANEPESTEVVEIEPEDPPAEPEAPDEPEEVAEEVTELTVTLTGVPEGATVLVGGEAIEGTELTVAGESLEVEVRADGFEPWGATVDAESDPSLAVELTAVEPEVEEPEPEAQEPEAEEPEAEEPEPSALTRAQIRRRDRRRERRQRARRRRRRGRTAAPRVRIAPNPY